LNCFRKFVEFPVLFR